MVVPTKQPRGYLATAWIAGIALAMVIAGAFGAVQPLLPPVSDAAARFDPGDEVLLEQFDPPSVAAEEEPGEPPRLKQPVIEIPPLPVIHAPLIPTEMVELTPLEEALPPAPVVKHVRAKPPAEPSRTNASGSGTRAAGGPGAPTTFTRGGGGRFPSPVYPASARANREQGTVRILVTVEANGLPSSATILSSSGSASLDNAARDQISRRWRWPAGEVRRYIVPVRFVIEP